jgi:pimeloyl-ACP methyl ester carboxylesterase
MTKPGVVVFIHGILGGAATWPVLLKHLENDPYVARFFDLKLFSYASPAAQFWPLKRIPDLEDVADQLFTALKDDSELSNYPCVLLVGHSQGGLIIQRMLVGVVEAGRARELSRIRGVVTFATPNGGSELFLSLRRGLEWIWSHPQEKQLRPFSNQIAEMHSVLLKRIVYAQRISDVSYPIRFDAYTGTEDGVVPAHSARGLFPNVGTLPGDHSSIIRPSGPNAGVVTAVVDACRRSLRALEPDVTVYKTDILDPKETSDLKAVEALLGENFLTGQKMRADDFRYWLKNYEEKFGLPMRVMLAREDERIIGVLMFHESVADSLIIIDYVACTTDVRVEGIALRKLIGQVRARAASIGIESVVFELEDPSALKAPDVDRARARVRKFQAFGGRTITGVRYLAPDMDNFGGGTETPLLLMYVAHGVPPKALPRARVQKIVNFVYAVWWRNWYSRHYEGREKELDAYVYGLYNRVAGSAAGLPENCALEGRR